MIFGAQGFDLLRFVPDADATLPASYKGTSGGSLWDLVVRQSDGGEWSLLQKRLIGVAYYEGHGEARHIMCHGPSGIYQQLFEQVRKKWPEAEL